MGRNKPFKRGFETTEWSRPGYWHGTSLGFGVWVGMACQILWLLPKHTQTVSISDLNMLHLALLPLLHSCVSAPNSQAKNQGQSALCADRLSGVRG